MARSKKTTRRKSSSSISSKKQGITYKDVGVDTAKISKVHSIIGSMIAGTHGEHVISGYGHYAGLISIDDERVLAIHIDGVGSKVIVASLAGKYSTIGIDCIAMNANDVVCVGAEPIAFVDYIAVRRPDADMVEEIMKGLAQGAREANLSIVGGELAVLPDLLADGFEMSKGRSKATRGRGKVKDRVDNAFDLAGAVIGIARKDELILGESINAGDVIVGIASNGLHANGYTLARHVLLSRYRLDERIDELNSTLEDELLKPTRIYVKPILDVIRRVDVHGIAHITGGAFKKLTRLSSSVKFVLNSMPEPPAIFRLIKMHAGVDDAEMYSTFNMGIGMCVVAARGDEDAIISICKSHDMDAMVIGRVEEGNGVYVNDVRIV
ncbi:Phosphoribosylformylglycinamidine cyclo-ligase [archaeon HR04]|nr:Phosphoribosylformylglycinamidine cyclo-ligase [archaeon HR04]